MGRPADHALLVNLVRLGAHPSLPDLAFSVEANVHLATYVVYTDPADDERHSAFVHGRTAALAAPGGAGADVGDTDFGRRTDRFVSDESFARLRQVRARRDPGGLFCTHLVGDGTQLNRRGPAR